MEKPSSTETLLISVQEAAKTLRVSARTVWNLVKHQGLPHVRLGTGRGRVLIPVHKLQAWIDRQVTSGSN